MSCYTRIQWDQIKEEIIKCKPKYMTKETWMNFIVTIMFTTGNNISDEISLKRFKHRNMSNRDKT